MRAILILLLVSFLLSPASFSQYFWEFKQEGESVGAPIDVEKYNPDNVYYGSEDIIYKSTDAGETFSPLDTPVPNSSAIKNIILNDDDPSEFLIAVRNKNNGLNKILNTTDSGNTWNILVDSLTFSYFGIPMTPDPSHPDTIYTMSAKTFMRSTDFGNTWTPITDSVGCSTPCDIEVFQDTSIILIGDNGTGIFKSVDYGQTWEIVYNTISEIPTIAVDYRIPGVAWATKWGNEGGLLKSTDYGSTWQAISFFDSTNMWGINVSPNNSNYIVAGKYLGGVMFISHDGGNSWVSAATGLNNYQVYIVDSMNVYAAQGNGFWKLNSSGFLPVELTSFTASIINNRVILNWITASETNNLGFDVERLKNYKIERLQGWKKIGFVEGFGTTTEIRTYSFIDDKKNVGSYSYRLKQIDFDGSFEYSPIVEVNDLVPNDFHLAQNFPNPFNPTTHIELSTPNSGFVSLKVYDILGREVATLINEEKPSGSYKIEFNGTNFSSGIYFYELLSERFSLIKKMILLK